MEIKNVTVLGAGLMGVGLAQVFAKCGDINVTVRSRKVHDDPYAPIIKNLDILLDNDALTEAEKNAVLRRISFTDDMAEAVKNADFIIESLPEVMEIKQDTFRDLEALTRDDTIYATNTSVMSVTEIAQKCRKKDRVVGTHFWNPPFLIPLVEVVQAEGTSGEVVETCMDLLRKAGKKPVRCRKDVPGFIANRLQHAIWREALSMVEKGIADPATVDEALRYGPGLRWPTLGILENADMTGLDLTLNIHRYIFKHLESSDEPSQLLVDLVEKGEVGFKAGKGYQTWTPAQMEASNRRLREYLIKVTKDIE
ncbi:MAG: 3-hydroxyacyl-CoA dehydrogenase family protein [Clostridiales Family XIII bacterium]|jgi:3-hydroxybutyryl-CoA dehydrogenase|nr:3-hydroxyacyl-CoA dehydrogenase family protein [Clostridiales Family XIII bacterium]